jgi:RNA polymerase sigma factor (sigma-70 family)
MANGQLATALRTICTLAAGRPAEDCPDGELLHRFAAGRDEAAFNALMQRHGPLVLGVCRRLCGHGHDAEDVFQATFLVLVRKAAALHRRGSLGPWLYTVAYHLALRARSRAIRRAADREVPEMPAAQPSSDLAWQELRAVLDEEMHRLPEKYRAPVVLCYLQGKTNEQAAAQLGWPKGTVFTRLTRARDLLRTRLTRRGLALSVGLLVPALAEQATAAVPSTLVTSTLKAALVVAAGPAAGGLSAPVAALVEGGMKQMFFKKLKIAVTLLLVLGVLGAGAMTLQLARADKEPQPNAKAPAAPEKGKAKAPSGDTFGYTAAFEEEVRKIGQITPQEFANRYPSKAQYLPKMTWDPTTARFWKEFSSDPKGLVRKPGVDPARWDFRLNKEELAKFKENGFVVSERMGSASFSELLYRIYSRDLPVYISSDAILHAWHRSYDAILEQLEETYLAQSLNDILTSMADSVPAAHKAYGNGVLAESLKDADYFLAVARSLLDDKQAKTSLDQEQRVADTLKACASLALIQDYPLFGRPRDIDFSQFKVRGHYENSELLKKYFKAMMWCGRTDMRIAGGMDAKSGGLSSPRELGGAIVLDDLLRRGGKFQQWNEFDQMIQTFVGKTDSATFAHLEGVLAKANLKSAADVKDLDTLKAVQDQILAGKIGMQHIRGDVYYCYPFGAEKAELPRSFTLLGQKFVMDSWVTSKIVYDDIVWDNNKVMRRIPSGLDVAFAALGNSQTVPWLVDRMTAQGGRKFRDGLNYQHNLAAVRNIIDAQDKAVWDENLYMHWLDTLRTLSEPTTDGKYPEVMRTRAWADKTLNTQLASWTQLRHDTILYVKQSYTGTTMCYYPAGYVEAVPQFWARLEKMANRAAALIDKTPYPDITFEKPHPYNPKVMLKVNVKAQKAMHRDFFKNFAWRVGTLRGIAEKELAQKELTAEETTFLKKVVEIIHRGSGGPTYSGWYFGMFYKGHTDADKWDALVADVHSDTPDPMFGDPGCVLTQGVGNVDLMMIAVDNGKDKMVYAGPVLSHYEFEMGPGLVRKSDSEWRKEINAGKLPPRPEWTRSYFVPGENPDAKKYKAE